MGFKLEAALNTLQYEMIQGGFLYEFHAFRPLLSVSWFVLISSVRHSSYGISLRGWFFFFFRLVFTEMLSGG